MDIVGKRVGLLVVKHRLPNSRVACLCDCGKTRILHTGHFNAGYFKSCGCHVVRHGHGAKNRSREYVSYYNMMARCHKPSNKRYKDYGAKGILVCQRWRDSFVNFINDMGACPEGYLIDRIDNTKGYSPENCRWVSRAENQNNRGLSKYWIVNGVRYDSVVEACAANNVSTATIHAWCNGRTAEGRYYPPKLKCRSIPKYKCVAPRRERYAG